MSENLLLELKNHIDEIALMSSEAWTEMVNIVQLTELRNEDFLFKEREKVFNEVFLSKGIFRGFYRSYEGEEINVYFFTPGISYQMLMVRGNGLCFFVKKQRDENTIQKSVMAVGPGYFNNGRHPF